MRPGLILVSCAIAQLMYLTAARAGVSTTCEAPTCRQEKPLEHPARSACVEVAYRRHRTQSGESLRQIASLEASASQSFVGPVRYSSSGTCSIHVMNLPSRASWIAM
jgi:hypothetical protein